MFNVSKIEVSGLKLSRYNNVFYPFNVYLGERHEIQKTDQYRIELPFL